MPPRPSAGLAELLVLVLVLAFARVAVLGQLLREQHDPVVAYMPANLPRPLKGCTYVLRARDLLRGWRPHLFEFVEAHNNATRHSSVKEAERVFVTATILEDLVERKLRSYGYADSLVSRGKSPHSDNQELVLESSMLSHEAVTQLLLASTQVEDHVLFPATRLHLLRNEHDQPQQQQPSSKSGGAERHYTSPLPPLLFSRNGEHCAAQYTNPIQLANDLATSLGLTVPPSLILRDRLTVTVDLRTPYAAPAVSPDPSPGAAGTDTLSSRRPVSDSSDQSSQSPPPSSSSSEAAAAEAKKTSPLLPLSQNFIIYQSRGAATGGSTALTLLGEQLRQLGHDVLECSEANLGPADPDDGQAEPFRREEPACRQPPLTSIVVTGEWCGAVLEEYGLDPGRHRGRSVQYHLGFHFDNPCRSAVAVAASHYLTSLLGSRVLGGYFLSAPMHHGVRDAFVELLLKARLLDSSSSSSSEEGGGSSLFFKLGGAERGELLAARPGMAADELLSGSVSWGHGQQTLLSVPKESLIVIDPDLIDDYPPEEAVPFSVPPGVRIVYAKDAHPRDMPLLLQRAKVLLDLAMPGPERLASEAVLMGAIPIVSNRWNGASSVDFPGVLRVDPQNSTSLTDTIARALRDYESLVADPATQGRFFAYVLSQWERHKQTARILAASGGLHFVLVAQRGVEEERAAVLRLFALLYLYPLASVDVYVVDTFWFVRHHYLAVALLKRAGYLRKDIADPRENNITTTFLPSRPLHGSSTSTGESVDGGGGASHVRFLRLPFLRDCSVGNSIYEHAGAEDRVSADPPAWRLVPPWAAAVVVLPSARAAPASDSGASAGAAPAAIVGDVFAEPLFLIELIEGYGHSGGVITLELPTKTLPGSAAEPAAFVMSAQTATSLHGCPVDEPWPELKARPGKDRSLLHMLATGDFAAAAAANAGLPEPRLQVALDGGAMVDELRWPAQPSGRLIDGLRKTAAWLELQAHYAETD